MRKLKPLDFTELTNSELKGIIGGGDKDTDPHPIETFHTTELTRTTNLDPGTVDDTFPDESSTNDNEGDYI